METHKILGSVRDEVARLDRLHHSMLAVNQQMLRILDAVPTSRTSIASLSEPAPPTTLVTAERKGRISMLPEYQPLRKQLPRPRTSDAHSSGYVGSSVPAHGDISGGVDLRGYADMEGGGVERSVLRMRRAVEVESNEYKRKLKIQLVMLDEIEVCLCLCLCLCRCLCLP